MRGFGYIGLAIVAAVFSVLFYVWGQGLPQVTSIEEVPGFFNTSNLVVSVLFFGSSWFVIYKGSGYTKAALMAGVGLTVWYVLVVGLAIPGFFAWKPLFAPNIMFAFILVLVLIKKVYSWKALEEAFFRVPLHWVFAVQVFRVMGVGFLALWLAGLLPGEFALPTGWGDVFIGVTGPIVAYFWVTGKSFAKSLAVLWNYLGIADLALAITLGIGTYPDPIKLIPSEIGNDPIALYPLVIIPVFAVPLSVLLHLFSLRELRRR